MNRDIREFAERQAAKLLDAARGCNDPKLQSELLAMAESWLQSLETKPEARPDTLVH